MYLSSWARCRTSHRLDTTLAAARFLESPASRQSPESLTPPQWVTSRACEQQVRLWLRDLTGQSWQELTSGPLGLCCYNWPTPLSGLSWPRVLPLSYPVPEWNHSVNRLIQPQPATGRAELLSWCACVCVCVCFRLYPCTCMGVKACAHVCIGMEIEKINGIASQVYYKMYWLI